VDAVVDQTIGKAVVTETINKDDFAPPPQEKPRLPDVVEKDRIKDRVESPGGPGVDPMKAMPITADDDARLPGLHINGREDENHRASTVHLPDRESQEKRVQELDESIARRAIVGETDARRLSLQLPPQLPPPNEGLVPDVVSSPSSTADAHSVATSVQHDTSTDTSPDHEGPRYHPERPDDKEHEPRTPPELAPSQEEIHEKESHDRILKAQMELARAEILGSSPTGQLRLEEEQAAAAVSADVDHKMTATGEEEIGPDGRTDRARELTNGSETAQDIMDDDEEDEVVGVPTPEDEKGPKEASTSPEVDGKPVSQPVVNGDLMEMEIDEPAPGHKKHADTSDVVISTPETHTAKDRSEAMQQSQSKLEASPSIAADSAACRSPLTVPTPPIERMTTRVSSGALRHKSVSEILGETPRSTFVSASERSGKAVAGNSSSSSSGSSTPASQSSRMRSLIEKAKDKERSKLSAVVFAKQAQKDSPATSLVPAGTKPHGPEYPDYFMPLILQQAYASTRGMQPLESLLQSAHKTITTSNAAIPFQEHQAHKIIRRIHHLQNADKWSFRQPKRAPEPNRPMTHWDELLKEAKWMRTDFREERKWKNAVARNLAYACAEWLAASPEDRKLLQVKARPPPLDEDLDTEMEDSVEAGNRTPELVPSSDNETPTDDFDDEPRISLLDTVAPTAIFSLCDDDVVFGLRKTPATDKLLEELPMYGTPLKVHQSDLPTSDVDPDASWKKPAIPLSKYMNGHIVLKDDGPPRKKSRYEYEQEDSDDVEVITFGDREKRSPLQPAQVDVALFNPENKHIRDRIHAGHQFRPPSEYPMPLQSFFECRPASQWTWAEDDELKTLVREYQYNWSLISSMLASKSLFSSGPERRTPWECFERWIHLEGLPADMQKTHYFRAYNNRIEAAQRNLMQAANAAPPQPATAGGTVTPVRRRTTTSQRVERRKNTKHLTLIHAMKRLANKRENNLQKQQNAAGLAAMRKANETQTTTIRHTPQDFSRLKHERELQLAERMARMQMQQEAARRVRLPHVEH
jgi:chromatin modification-related protein VID21